MTPTDALRELLEAIATLEGVTFSRDLEPYKAEAVWDDAVRRAQDALAAAERDESELVAALRAMMDCYFDYHDAHSLTQPVTGRAGNAMDWAIEALAKHAKKE